MSKHAAIKSWSTIIDELQEAGRYTFTHTELADLGERPDQGLSSALRRLKEKGRIASPRRGFYVIVPLEYRIAGGPPATWFVDDLMEYLTQPYYVALLSAAAVHGAAHQQPMVFQVVTDRPTRPARLGRSRIEFHRSHQASSIPAIRVETETGTVRVSTPEATALDLLHYAEASGRLSNVATVLSELAETLDAGTLTETAALYPTPDSQRLGYLLDLLGETELARPLASWLVGRKLRPVPLALGKAHRDQPVDPRWQVIPNMAIEVDT